MWTKKQLPLSAGGAITGLRPGTPLQVLPALERPAKNPVGGGVEDTGKDRDRFKVRDLFVDERCSQAILDFLATTDVGRRLPTPAEEDAQSEASEHELREMQERQEAEEAGALGVEQQLVLPAPSFMASAEEE
jgi:hypothetical protein